MGERPVINLHAQRYSGRPQAGLETAAQRERWFEQAIEQIPAHVPALRSLALPAKIGCGIGGGSWQVYRRIIDRFAAKYPEIQIAIYDLTAVDLTAEEATPRGHQELQGLEPGPKVTFTVPAHPLSAIAATSSTISAQRRTPLVFVLVGTPGSGKTAFCQRLKDWLVADALLVPERISQDELRSRARCVEVATQALVQGRSVIIDRCNFDRAQRNTWQSLASDFNCHSMAVFWTLRLTSASSE